MVTEKTSETTSDSGPRLPLAVPRSPTSSPPDGGRGIFQRLLGRAIYIPVILALVFGGGIIGMYFQPPGLQKFFETTGLKPGAGSDNAFAVAVGEPETDTPPASPVSASDVVALARLLPISDVITISPPFGAGDSRVAEIMVEEGDRVEANDVIAIMDNLASLESAVANAKASVAVSEATLSQTRDATSASQAEARANLEAAQSELKNAEDALQRSRQLFERGIVTRSNLDNAETAAEQARKNVDRMQATLRRFETTTIDDQSDVIVALRNLELARAALAQAERDLSKAYVRSPMAGTIIDVHVQRGEKPGSEGIADIGDLETMKAEIEVYQSLIGRVEIGQRVSISAVPLDETLSGTVTKIGFNVGRQSITTDDPAAKTDARVVTVTATLDEASSRRASKFTNLEVVARIETEPGS